MYTVSREYTEQMQKSVRNRGYMEVTLGLVHRDSQNTAVFSSATDARLTSDRKPFDSPKIDKIYATLDGTSLKVNSGQGEFYAYPPKVGEDAENIETCNTSRSLLSSQSSTETKTITVPGDYLSAYGFTIEFDENYPIDFDLIFELKSGGTFSQFIRGNGKRVWSMTPMVEDASSCRIIFRKMRYYPARPRIRKIYFGINITYTNNDIMSSTLTNSISDIGEELPQTDFSVTLLNFNKQFDVEDDDSTVHMLEPGQEITVSYGYELDNGEIEWVPGTIVYCTDWEIGNNSFTLNACDKLRDLDQIYYNGKHRTQTVSYLNLMQDVIDNQSQFSMDYVDLNSNLSNVNFKNAIPPVTTKEALQMISNAMCAIILNGRDGRVQIKKVSSNPVFQIDARDVFGFCTITKNDKIKEVIATYESYSAKGNNEDYETVYNGEFHGVQGVDEYFYFDNPLCRVALGDGSSTHGQSISAFSDYWVAISHTQTVDYDLEIKGQTYNKVTQRFVRNIAEKGGSITWSNPLIHSRDLAQNLAAFIGNHYQSSLTYEFDYRGNPELDVGDVITLHMKDDTYVDMRICELEMSFSGTFRGHIVARKIG